MSTLFGGKMPAAPAQPPPVPSLSSQAVLQSEQQQELAAAEAAGRASTILTSGMGDTNAPTVQKKALLGG